jgi:hypothetical protein
VKKVSSASALVAAPPGFVATRRKCIVAQFPSGPPGEVSTVCFSDTGTGVRPAPTDAGVDGVFFRSLARIRTGRSSRRRSG